MAKSEGITKPLTLIIGLAICYLIFNPPVGLRALGVGGYLIAAAAILFVIVGLCFYAVLINHPAQVVPRQEKKSRHGSRWNANRYNVRYDRIEPARKICAE